MAFNHTISAVLRGRWAINPNWANEQMPIISNFIQGGTAAFVEDKKPPIAQSLRSYGGVEEISQPYAVNPKTMQETSIYAAMPGSVGVITIAGAILKYDGECGQPGSISLANFIAKFEEIPNINSIVLKIDTPGGETRAASVVVAAMAKSKKPILAYVDGMAASLGLWFTSAAKEVYLSGKTDEIGSVGSYCCIYDFSGYMEKKGIKLHEIYAPQSKDKNFAYKEAKAGNKQLIEEELKVYVDDFISFIATNRGEKAAASVKAWNSGKMFFANDAIRFGLADGIMGWRKLISRAAFLGNLKKD